MDRVLISIGPITIYWYSFLIFLSILIGLLIVKKEVVKTKLDKDFVFDLIFYLIPVAIVGARIYYVIFNYSVFKDNLIDIFKIWEGGLAIHGGIIAGLITIIIMTKKHKISTLEMTDMIVVGVIIAQAIGRWGNFFNGEAYGPVTTLDNLKQLHIPQFIINGMNINGVYYHPTFLYESLWNILGFIFLIILKHTNKLKTGQLTGTYFIWYSVGRFFIESLRQDSLMLFGILKQAQIISIILIIIGIIIIFISRKNKKYCEE